MSSEIIWKFFLTIDCALMDVYFEEKDNNLSSLILNGKSAHWRLNRQQGKTKILMQKRFLPLNLLTKRFMCLASHLGSTWTCTLYLLVSVVGLLWCFSARHLYSYMHNWKCESVHISWVELLDFTNKNTWDPVKFEFQINRE